MKKPVKNLIDRDILIGIIEHSELCRLSQREIIDIIKAEPVIRVLSDRIVIISDNEQQKAPE